MVKYLLVLYLDEFSYLCVWKVLSCAR